MVKWTNEAVDNGRFIHQYMPLTHIKQNMVEDSLNRPKACKAPKGSNSRTFVVKC